MQLTDVCVHMGDWQVRQAAAETIGGLIQCGYLSLSAEFLVSKSVSCCRPSQLPANFHSIVAHLLLYRLFALTFMLS